MRKQHYFANEILRATAVAGKTLDTDEWRQQVDKRELIKSLSFYKCCETTAESRGY